jgi:hypothetical protein
VTRALALVLLAACGEDTITIVPVIDRPLDEEADALPDLTQIRIAIENAGDDEPDRIFDKGETVALDNVPLISGLVVRLDGFMAGQGVAVGRSCPFSLADGNRPEPRIYLSAIARTGLLGIEAGPRRGGASFTLADDTIFLVGGDDNVSLERFDPRTGLIAALEHDPFDGRVGASIATFEDGRPAIIGGFINGDDPATDALLVSSSGVVERVPDSGANVGRINMTATTLPDGQILITGGSDLAGVASDKIVRMKIDAETDIIELELVNSATLTAPRESHVLTALGDEGASLIVTGGNNGAALVAQTEIYRTNSDEIILLESPKFDLKHPRRRHRAALLPDESVVIFGGVDAAGNPVREIERFSLIGGVEDANNTLLPPGAPAIDIGVVTLPGGQILLVGGRPTENTPPQTNVFTIDFNSENNTVSLNARDPLAVPRNDPQLSVLCDGTVLITGGTDEPDDVERFNPSARPRL